MKSLLPLAALALSVTAHPTLAADYTLGDLTISQPIAFETPKTARAGAGYISITNAGETSDRLLAVEADFPRVMLHNTEENDGVARMVHLDGIDIPAGATVALSPGGMHVMFMGLDGDPFEAGESFDARLIFENAGAIDVAFKVTERKAAHSGDGHSGHGGHGGHSGHGASADHSGHGG